MRPAALYASGGETATETCTFRCRGAARRELPGVSGAEPHRHQVKEFTRSLDPGPLLPRYSGGEGLGMRGLRHGKINPSPPAPLPGVPGRGERGVCVRNHRVYAGRHAGPIGFQRPAALYIRFGSSSLLQRLHQVREHEDLGVAEAITNAQFSTVMPGTAKKFESLETTTQLGNVRAMAAICISTC